MAHSESERAWWYTHPSNASPSKKATASPPRATAPTDTLLLLNFLCDIEEFGDYVIKRVSPSLTAVESFPRIVFDCNGCDIFGHYPDYGPMGSLSLRRDLSPIVQLSHELISNELIISLTMAASTTITVSEDTWRRLHSLKDPGDSFNDVLQRILNECDSTEEVTE